LITPIELVFLTSLGLASASSSAGGAVVLDGQAIAEAIYRRKSITEIDQGLSFQSHYTYSQTDTTSVQSFAP